MENVLVKLNFTEDFYESPSKNQQCNPDPKHFSAYIHLINYTQLYIYINNNQRLFFKQRY